MPRKRGGFTERQKEVMKELNAGKNPAEIARELEISRQRVNNIMIAITGRSDGLAPKEAAKRAEEDGVI